MIFVGLDDTDTRETPGTVKLAIHLSKRLDAQYEPRWIVRHQLLEDPRVPCTNRNGCVSLALEPRAGASTDRLIEELLELIIRWCPTGSDPGLCVVEHAPERFVAWGRSAQSELLEMSSAVDLARAENIYLAPLGGTGGGVIGALAAIGLLSTWNSGRVIYSHRFAAGATDLTGFTDVATLYAVGVDDIISLDNDRRVDHGVVNLTKRLRPNLRAGRVALYVAQHGTHWESQRIVA